MTFTSTPSTGVASNRSSALPAGMPLVSGMSTRTMSPSSFAAAQCAQVAPTFPAPIMLIFARRMSVVSDRSWFEKWGRDYPEWGGGCKRLGSETRGPHRRMFRAVQARRALGTVECEYDLQRPAPLPAAHPGRSVPRFRTRGRSETCHDPRAGAGRIHPGDARQWAAGDLRAAPPGAG